MNEKYTKQLDYLINNSNSKEVLANKIVKKIKNINKKLIITDLGSGSGIVSKKINNLTNNLHQFILIDNYNYHSKINNGFNFIQANIEKITIPKSNIIIISQAIQYLKNPIEMLNKILKSLDKDGFIIIVNTDTKSQDAQIKKNILNITTNSNILNQLLINHLNTNKIRYELEKVHSTIKLDQNKNDILEFIFKKENIALVEKKLLNNELKKIENYFWIYNN